ncbi:rCG63025 [Rattus norvegicus]|uniref:RCG63025 n=1 Tax=Rattus norvegicus TaxID=10116 RepID=A6JEQ5_RAT|nr:rCG63025 [Rattus norvegicus]
MERRGQIVHKVNRSRSCSAECNVSPSQDKSVICLSESRGVTGIFIKESKGSVSGAKDGTLGKHPEVQKDQDSKKQLDSGTLASINTDFALSLYKQLALKNPDTNIVFSPLSIATSLASLSLGTKGNTLQEILEGLKFNLTETPEADILKNYRDLLHRLSQPGGQGQISRSNALFVEKHLQFLNVFKEKTRSLYLTEVFTANFQEPCEARKLINDYMRIQSQGGNQGNGLRAGGKDINDDVEFPPLYSILQRKYTPFVCQHHCWGQDKRYTVKSGIANLTLYSSPQPGHFYSIPGPKPAEEGRGMQMLSFIAFLKVDTHFSASEYQVLLRAHVQTGLVQNSIKPS